MALNQRGFRSGGSSSGETCQVFLNHSSIQAKTMLPAYPVS